MKLFAEVSFITFVGRFDDLDSVGVGHDTTNSNQFDRTWEIQYNAGLQAVVLLKNDGNRALPLAR